MEQNSLNQVIEKLENLFSLFNKQLFNDELEKPVIAVLPDTTKGAYGWCTAWKAWKQGDESDGHYEINMCAEYLNRPFEQTCSTLIHEMVHLLNLQNEVQDTSRSGMYHNKKFKTTAEQHGLLVEKDAKYGYCKTKLTEETAKWLKSTFNGEEGFTLHRSKLPKLSAAGKGSSSKKYVCPGCGTIIRATKTVHVVCGECKLAFEEQDVKECTNYEEKN